jgi:hypothetical protein
LERPDLAQELARRDGFGDAELGLGGVDVGEGVEELPVDFVGARFYETLSRWCL